jgi:hypothetical protein
MFLTMSSGPATFKDKELQVVGKLSAEKPGHANGIAQTLGKIWCSIKGIRCRDLGCNLFEITSQQPEGKRRAIEEGPWASF